MKDLDLATLVAVFQEMLGWTLWAWLSAAVLATLAFAWVLLRDRRVVPRRLLWAEALGVAGGIAAVLFMQSVTSSGFADLGGPVDWLLVVGIFAGGAVGATVASYALLGLLSGAPARDAQPLTKPSPATA